MLTPNGADAQRTYQREYTRRRRNIPPEDYRIDRLSQASSRECLLPAAPFAVWLRHTMERDATSKKETARGWE